MVPARREHDPLVLTTSVTATRQWIANSWTKPRCPERRSENQRPHEGHSTGDHRDLQHPHLAADKTGRFAHLELFDQRDWGLIIYDEVHLLPAPVFQVTAGRRPAGGWA